MPKWFFVDEGCTIGSDPGWYNVLKKKKKLVKANKSYWKITVIESVAVDWCGAR